MNENETIAYDCSRGCSIRRNQDDQLVIRYREGCCKLSDYDYLKGVEQPKFDRFFEVRFKNIRKGIYVNESGQRLRIGDLVVVESSSGHDLGIVTLDSPMVGRQMRCKNISPEGPMRKIYRKARPYDIEKWQEAVAREHETMIRAREIASRIGLHMKIGDVEFQGDGTKAIFYYIADGRVDFRQLIKLFAEEFHIRVEMRQIGARQEAGLIGGLGVCGRELCCAKFITSFKSISTSAARCQDLSLNPQKLAGQCGKLKCCLNYEVATYREALSRLPKVVEPLEFEDGLAYLMKTDILRGLMYFSYDKGSLADIYPLETEQVAEIIQMNRHGEKPKSLIPDKAPKMPDFFSGAGQESITRFDKPKKNKNKNKNKPKGPQNQQQGQPQSQQQAPPNQPQGQPNPPQGQQSSQSQQPRQQGGKQRGKGPSQGQGPKNGVKGKSQNSSQGQKSGGKGQNQNQGQKSGGKNPPPSGA